ncbi:hypothetical protein ONE63_005795 [Megalurothrips usitatus]|uniref:Uncharacterized protein n=1 Tax=Megalurothrips usitatus TaxID=439358 RepID=A0AAV7XXC2_9NEOP|nr:hypothetical protein ONE63_005795 [Megalurothrips usitatus]
MTCGSCETAGAAGATGARGGRQAGRAGRGRLGRRGRRGCRVVLPCSPPSFCSINAAREARLKLRDVRIALSPLSGPAAASTAAVLAVPRDLRLCAELLDESLGTLVATLEQLEELRESHETSKSLASVATVLASTAPGNSWFASLHPDVQSGLSRLRETERYKVGLHSFKQWAFPFAQLYLSNESLSTTSASRGNAVAIASAGLERLLGRMEMYHSVVVQGHDTYIRVRSFEEPLALYAWGPEEHAEQLDRLLDGREVFSVSLETQRIEMAVARKAHGDGTPVFFNKVYDKLRSGDMMLSPFALWKVHFRAESGKPLPGELQSFKGGVRLVLEGHAQYVSGFECGEALDEFYTSEPSKADLNTIII